MLEQQFLFGPNNPGKPIEEVNLLKTGQRILEDELKKKDKLLQTIPYLNCLATLTVKEKKEEVKRKEELVKKEIRKRQASTRSYLDCLHKLSDLENELENVERIYGQKVRAA
ncbi:unnamed protein product [Pleuronectes platessa]|uniref:Uncharacterized protein n=1 Tax=Pleuronectes platessa TaxID=8262 RepID=A0A9N7Y9X9_PLEPL|nr:unnamed protein product [Pleuronectes platessa]